VFIRNITPQQFRTGPGRSCSNWVSEQWWRSWLKFLDANHILVRIYTYQDVLLSDLKPFVFVLPWHCFSQQWPFCGWIVIVVISMNSIFCAVWCKWSLITGVNVEGQVWGWFFCSPCHFCSVWTEYATKLKFCSYFIKLCV